jgi:hypothetical protein
MCGQIPTFPAEHALCGANASKHHDQDEIDITTLVSSVSSVESEDLGYDQEDLYIHDSPVNDGSHSRDNFADPCAATNNWVESCKNQHSFRSNLTNKNSAKLFRCPSLDWSSIDALSLSPLHCAMRPCSFADPFFAS